MDIVEQYAKLNDATSGLEHQSDDLRQDLLRPGARLSSTQYEVVVRRQAERVLKTELLPPEILNDPSFWDVASRDEVDIRPLGAGPAYMRPEPAVRVDLLRYRC